MDVKTAITELAAAAVIGAASVGVIDSATREVEPYDLTRPGEVVELRTENSIAVRQEDGTIKATVRSYPLNWRDENGNLRAVDTTVQAKPLVKGLVSKYEYTTVSGVWTAEFDSPGESDDYRFTHGGAWIEYELETDGLTVTHTTHEWGVKEDVRLDGPKTDTVTWRVNASDSLVWDGATLRVRGSDVRMLPVTVTDAAGVPVEYGVEWDGERLTVAVKSTDDTAWPVTVDPSTTYTAVLDGHTESRSADEATARNATNAVAVFTNALFVGRDKDSSYTFYRSFLTLPIPLTQDSVYAVTGVSLFLNGGTDHSKTDFQIYVVGAEAYGPTLTTADVNQFDGWQAIRPYNGTVLNDSTYSALWSADWNEIVFNAAGRDSLIAALGDTLRIALMSKRDYANTPSVEGKEYVTYVSSAGSDDPYIEITYTLNAANTPGVMCAFIGGGPVYDGSGNGNHGIPTGNPAFRRMADGNHYYEFGGDDALSCGTDSSAILIDGWTMAVRFRTAADGTILQRQGNAEHGHYLLRVSGGNLEAQASDRSTYSSTITSPDSVTDDAWRTAVVSSDRDSIRMYLDGSWVASVLDSTADVLGAPDSTLWIGKYSGGDYYTGDLAWVRLFQRSLTPAQVDSSIAGTLADYGGERSVSLEHDYSFPDSVVRFILDPNANPDSVEYAVQDSVSGLYADVTADPCTLKVGETWGTYDDWGGAAGMILHNLPPDSLIVLRAKARN